MDIIVGVIVLEIVNLLNHCICWTLLLLLLLLLLCLGFIIAGNLSKHSTRKTSDI